MRWNIEVESLFCTTTRKVGPPGRALQRLDNQIGSEADRNKSRLCGIEEEGSRI